MTVTSHTVILCPHKMLREMPLVEEWLKDRPRLTGA